MDWSRTLSSIRSALPTEAGSEALRTARDFVGRTAAGPIDERIAFIRVPKCATTAVDSALMRLYLSTWVFEGNGIERIRPGACDGAVEGTDAPTWTARRTMLAYYLGHPRTRYTSGHVEVCEPMLERFGDEFNFIVTLRDPVDRWISHFLYNKYGGSDEPGYDINDDIESFLDSNRGRGIGQLFVSYLAGAGGTGPDYRERDAVQQRARRNLDRFDLVGFVEELDAFTADFERQFGVELDLPRSNPNPAPIGPEDISDEVRARIRDVCDADVRLYEYARETRG
ncbi:MAG: hypothetical protein ABEL76_12530 [Bradymonadaceae bacterium]